MIAILHTPLTKHPHQVLEQKPQSINYLQANIQQQDSLSFSDDTYLLVAWHSSNVFHPIKEVTLR